MDLSKKLLKYLVLFALFSGPFFLFLHTSQSVYYAFVDSEIQQAKIIKCVEIVTRKGNRIRRTWHTVARSRTRKLVTGSVGKRTQKVCEKNIDKEVRISFSRIAKGKDQILTFEEIWLYPIMAFIFCIIFYLLSIFAYLSQRKK